MENLSAISHGSFNVQSPHLPSVPTLSLRRPRRFWRWGCRRWQRRWRAWFHGFSCHCKLSIPTADQQEAKRNVLQGIKVVPHFLRRISILDQQTKFGVATHEVFIGFQRLLDIRHVHRHEELFKLLVGIRVASIHSVPHGIKKTKLKERLNPWNPLKP